MTSGVSKLLNSPAVCVLNLKLYHLTSQTFWQNVWDQSYWLDSIHQTSERGYPVFVFGKKKSHLFQITAEKHDPHFCFLPSYFSSPLFFFKILLFPLCRRPNIFSPSGLEKWTSGHILVVSGDCLYFIQTTCFFIQLRTFIITSWTRL